jgi:predicted dithiol-disulfide oxidoreductase (DUF899 family)
MESQGKKLNGHAVVSNEEWLVARKRLLEREKQVQKEIAKLAEERRALPWVKVEKNYSFGSARDGAPVSLADIFGFFFLFFFFFFFPSFFSVSFYRRAYFACYPACHV